MRNIYILTVLFLLASCNNCPNNIEYNYLRPKISHSLVNAFTYYIEHEEQIDTSTFYAIMFSKGEPGFSREDTLIGIMKMVEMMPMDGFKGMISIGGYKVLVFDIFNLGESFYISDSLEDVDLNNIPLSPCYGVEDFCTFVLDRGKYLRLIGVQPDDFESIKI